MSEWLLNGTFTAISWWEQVNFQWDDDDDRCVLDQHAELDFDIASSLKQQFVDRHVDPHGHIILIPSQPIFALSPSCCMLSGEATNTNLIVIGLTRTGLKPTIYWTWGEHADHYTIDAVLFYFFDIIKWTKCIGSNEHVIAYLVFNLTSKHLQKNFSWSILAI